MTNYEKAQDIIIVLLDVALAVCKGIKKLRSLVKKKASKLSK